MAKKSKKRRAWTSTEVRELKSMARKKTPAGRIAKKLKRSEGATRQKAFSIGLSLDFAFLISLAVETCKANWGWPGNAGRASLSLVFC